jgi:hypothetical protein
MRTALRRKIKSFGLFGKQCFNDWATLQEAAMPLVLGREENH